jgi:hypothetical protein
MVTVNLRQNPPQGGRMTPELTLPSSSGVPEADVLEPQEPQPGTTGMFLLVCEANLPGSLL